LNHKFSIANTSDNQNNVSHPSNNSALYPIRPATSSKTNPIQKTKNKSGPTKQQTSNEHNDSDPIELINPPQKQQKSNEHNDSDPIELNTNTTIPIQSN
jgi:hypothetical protein